MVYFQCHSLRASVLPESNCQMLPKDKKPNRLYSDIEGEIVDTIAAAHLCALLKYAASFRTGTLAPQEFTRRFGRFLKPSDEFPQN